MSKRPADPTGEHRPPISAVIPTHAGSIEWLPDCLAAVAAQRGVTPQVIVVVDGPAPAVPPLVRRLLPGARVVERRQNAGFATAASAGLRVARGALVALLNDDAEPEPDWLGALLDAAARNPDAGSFASLVLQRNRPGYVDSAGHGLTRWGEAFEIAHDAPETAAVHTERPVFGAPACASAYRWELLRDCGAFDTAFGAYLEDVDLSLRAQLLGFPCLFVPTARVHHRGSASYGTRSVQLSARNRVRLLLKSMPRPLLREAAPAVAASIAADLAARLNSKHAAAAAAGLIEGLTEARAAVAGRASTLGPRRVDDDRIRDLLIACESDLQQLPERGAPRARRLALARRLATLTDSRRQQGEPWS